MSGAFEVVVLRLAFGRLRRHESTGRYLIGLIIVKLCFHLSAHLLTRPVCAYMVHQHETRSARVRA